MYRMAFLMEQHLGHRTYYQNLRSLISLDPRIEAEWCEITYYQEDSSLDNLPILPRGVRGTWRGIRQVHQGLGRGNYDAAFFNTQVPAALAFDKLGKLAFVLSTDITPVQYDIMAKAYNHRSDPPGPVRWLKHHINQEVFQSAKQVIAWSASVKRSLEVDYGVDPRQISVIPPGVKLDFWSPGPGRVDQIPLRLLFVGGDFIRKGGDTLLNAFRQLPPGAAELHMVTRQAVEHMPGLFVYHRMTPNSIALRDLYRQCDVYILPSRAEAYGIAAVEALACGLPVIASHVGGLREIVQEGVTGFYISPGDENALTCALQALLEDHQMLASMKKAARMVAEEKYDASKYARQVADLMIQATG